MPRPVMIPPMDITAEELADRLLALPPNPRKKPRRETATGSSSRPAPPLPMVAKKR